MRHGWVCGLAVASALAGSAAAAEPFDIPARDGYILHGQVDRPAEGGREVLVLMVPGSGPFNRDVAFGNSGTDDDKLFKVLAARVTTRGVASLRFDVRGVGYGDRATDRPAMALRTTTSSRDDLADLYAWARKPEGGGARCVILFGHSEGLAHIGRLADSGAPAPLAVLAMGGLLESPQSVMRWQLAGRNVQAIRAMDADHDGRTTNAEIQAGFANSIGSAMLPLSAIINPNGGWGEPELTAQTAAEEAFYEQAKALALSQADAAPYPDAATGWNSWQWWKSWFTDDRPVAQALAGWNVPVRVHYGDRDSQTDAPRQIAAGKAALGDRFSYVVHPGVGHGLGPNVTVGPMLPALADQLADDLAAAAARCR